LEKLTVVIIKSGSWRTAYKSKSHPEYSAIFDLLNLYESKINFILVGTSKTHTNRYLLRSRAIAWDIKATGRFSSFTYHIALMKLLFKYKPNLVIVLGLLNVLPVTIYSFLSRKSKYIPIFIGEIGYYGTNKFNSCLMTLSLKILGITLQLSKIKIMDAFTLSTYAQKCVEKLAPKLSGKIKLVAYPIPLVFNVDHKSFLIKNHKEPVILTVAGIEPRKGLDTLIKAVSLIPMKLRVIIKGSIRDNSYMDKLRVMTKKLNVEEKVTFVTNFVDYGTLASYYKSATLFVFPTREDSLGVVILEALHCGLPVIATSVGGIPDMIEDGVNGILVKPDDPQALANAISMVLKDYVLRRKIVANTKSVLYCRYYRGRLSLKEALIRSINRFAKEEKYEELISINM
jgi:glycosyltransferase involved in cell wall biosynthesis